MKVKSDCPPHTEDVMPKPLHTPLFSETVGNLHGIELWGRKRWNRLSKEKRETVYMQSKTVGRSFLWVTMVMNHTPVHAT